MLRADSSAEICYLVPGIISVYTVLIYNVRVLCFLNAQVEACRVSYDRSLVRRPHTPVVFVAFYVRQNRPTVTVVVATYYYCAPLLILEHLAQNLSYLLQSTNTH